MDITNTAKCIAELVKKGMSLELQEKIMQLREEALELQEENIKLKTENVEFKKKEELQDKIQYKGNVYYLDGDNVPYCPHCYDKDKSLIHLITDSRTPSFCNCQACKSQYVNRQGNFVLREQRRN